MPGCWSRCFRRNTKPPCQICLRQICKGRSFGQIRHTGHRATPFPQEREMVVSDLPEADLPGPLARADSNCTRVVWGANVQGFAALRTQTSAVGLRRCGYCAANSGPRNPRSGRFDMPGRSSQRFRRSAKPPCQICLRQICRGQMARNNSSWARQVRVRQRVFGLAESQPGRHSASARGCDLSAQVGRRRAPAC
ncbi:hypothetical protein CCANI_07960 [Corynebacterium canis]|nr:hypothetical protein CCANI_07960 [Corynebacterium canis]